MLEFIEVTKIYKRRPVLKNISFKVETGDFLLLSGPSSSGKSTILQLAYMDAMPSKGVIEVMGFYSNKTMRKHLPILRRKIGFISQEEKFLEHKTVLVNLKYELKLIEKQDINILGEILKKLRLFEKRDFYPLELSASERQKFKIALALAKSPVLLLADEPLNNLDDSEGEEVLSLLQGINADGTTVVIATSKENIVAKHATRMIYIENGEIKSATL